MIFLQTKTIRVGLIASLVLLFFSSFKSNSQASDAMANRTYVRSSEYGLFYAKSIPYEDFGDKGITNIYRVTEKEDILVQTYDRYSYQIYLDGSAGGQNVYVVQIDPPYRRTKSAEEHVAIVFYKDDTEVKKYSAFDIENITSNFTGYRIRNRGFRRPFGNWFVYDLEIDEGEIISFDTESGEVISKDEEMIREQLHYARHKISFLRYEWYERNEDEISGINEVLITEEHLREMAPEDFPELPQGYRYIPGAKWQRIEFKKMQKE